jgi:hypothetical protein
MMTKPFGGSISVDIRDSEPDWTPFGPVKAPEGAPNVAYIVLDDVGFSAVSCYGGPIATPNIDRIANNGVRYRQRHTTALCSPTRSTASEYFDRISGHRDRTGTWDVLALRELFLATIQRSPSSMETAAQ